MDDDWDELGTVFFFFGTPTTSASLYEDFDLDKDGLGEGGGDEGGDIALVLNLEDCLFNYFILLYVYIIYGT